MGLKLWTPPCYKSEGFLGWAPATPSFFGHRSLVWLVAGAPFRFVVVQAPCQKGKKMCFHPMSLYSIYSEFSGEFNNGQKWAFFQSSQNNYLIPDRVLVKDVQYPSWWNIARATARSWVHFLGLAYTCHCAKAVELFPPFFPMAHHETNLQRQGYVANLVYKKCSPQNYKRGGVWVGQKWGGWVQSWVGGSCPKYPPPPSYKRSLVVVTGLFFFLVLVHGSAGQSADWGLGKGGMGAWGRGCDPWSKVGWSRNSFLIGGLGPHRPSIGFPTTQILS